MGVEFIIIDMYRTYQDLASVFFKNAIVCIDPFHLTKKVNDSINAHRKYVMRKKSKDKKSKEYRLLKHSYKVLLKQRKDLEIEKRKYSRILGYSLTERDILERILEIDDDMKELVQKGASTEEIRRRAKENGMLSLKDTCSHAVLNGETSLSELMDVIFDIDE